MRFATLLAAVVFACTACFAQDGKDPQPGQPAAGNGDAKTPQPTAKPEKPEKKDDQPAAAKAAVDKVAFTTTDVCSQTGCEIRYDVKAKGDKAYVEMTYAHNARVLGRRDGSTSAMILDLENNTIRYLDPQRKLYSVANTAGLRGTPLAKIIAVLRTTPDVSAFMKDTKPHGTLGELKTIDTTIASAEQNAKFSDRLLEVPDGFRRMREDTAQRGGISGTGMPGTVFTGGGR